MPCENPPKNSVLHLRNRIFVKFNLTCFRESPVPVTQHKLGRIRMKNEEGPVSWFLGCASAEERPAAGFFFF